MYYIINRLVEFSTRHFQPTWVLLSCAINELQWGKGANLYKMFYWQLKANLVLPKNRLHLEPECNFHEFLWPLNRMIKMYITTCFQRSILWTHLTYFPTITTVYMWVNLEFGIGTLILIEKHCIKQRRWLSPVEWRILVHQSECFCDEV